MRPGFLAALAAASLCARAAENELPKQPAKGDGAGGAELFRGESGDVLFPNAKLSDTDFLLATEPPADVERAKTAYERARSKEQRWQRLCKAGVLAQVEVERVTLQVARSRVSLERARVAQQEGALAELRQRAGGAPPDTISAAESALETARTMLAEAVTSLKRTELLFAEANVDRQRRLLKMGAGSKTMLQRAEAVLAQLKTPAQ